MYREGRRGGERRGDEGEYRGGGGAKIVGEDEG